MMKTVSATLVLGLATLALSVPAAAGTDKTLVSWVTLANTTQQGGSALTIQQGDQFDAIVFGERAPGKWMAGSNFFKRTQGDQQANAVEKADGKTLIQMAIVYKGNQISIYRNGEPYASYEADNIDLLSAEGQHGRLRPAACRGGDRPDPAGLDRGRPDLRPGADRRGDQAA